MGKLFGSDAFDPRYIISQMLLLQCIFYSTHLSLTALLNMIFGLRSHLGQLFSTTSLEAQDSYSLVFILSSMLSVPFLVASLVYLVERTSKCLDFTATMYLLHLVFVCIYSGIPLSIVWWAVNGGALFITVLASEYICLKIEQQEISLTFSQKKSEEAA